MQLMDMKGLLSAMNWMSLSAFCRHYLLIISKSLQPGSLPGGPLASVDDVDDPVPGTSGVNSS